jgi:hypothetical protein
MMTFIERYAVDECLFCSFESPRKTWEEWLGELTIHIHNATLLVRYERSCHSFYGILLDTSKSCVHHDVAYSFPPLTWPVGRAVPFLKSTRCCRTASFSGLCAHFSAQVGGLELLSFSSSVRADLQSPAASTRRDSPLERRVAHREPRSG